MVQKGCGLWAYQVPTMSRRFEYALGRYGSLNRKVSPADDHTSLCSSMAPRHTYRASCTGLCLEWPRSVTIETFGFRAWPCPGHSSTEMRKVTDVVTKEVDNPTRSMATSVLAC